jgi:hypothetical protein
MGQTQINEPIDVIAKFSKGSITPLIFKYKSRVIKIESVDLKYDLHQDKVNFSSFSVLANGNSYKINYNDQTHLWILEEIFIS